MKKFQILATVAAATILGLTSCNKDNGGNDYNPEGKQAEISINIAGAESKATGDLGDPADGVINNVTVFVLNESDVVIDKKFILAADLPATDAKAIKTTDVAKKVFVVANMGDVTASATNLAGIEAMVADLGAATAAQTSGNVFMTSGAPVTLGAFAGSPLRVAVTVPMEFVGAKVVVKWALHADAVGDGSKWDFKTYVNRANGKMNVGATRTTACTGLDIYSAIPGADTGITTATSLMDAAAAGADNHYYVFGGNATIVGVEATLKTNSAIKRYYTYVFDGSDKDNHTLAPQNVYALTLNLKGDFNNESGGGEEGGGGEDPNGKVTEAFIDATITPATWNARISISKDI